MEECKQESKINQVVDKKGSESNIGSEMMNNNGNIAEVVVLENKTLNNDYSADSVVVVENG